VLRLRRGVEKTFFLWQPDLMQLEIPDIESAGFSAAELRLELACALYARGKISAVAASHLANVDLLTLQGALKERGIPRNYSIDDFRDDMNALTRLFPG
jgi:predicted HTH domain antitoxin